MKTTIYNILSNLITRFWSILISIIVLPIYTKILGFESYGLIGFFSTLLGSLAILDLGLSATLNREMSRSLVLNTKIEDTRNMVYSIELIYWAIGFLIGIGVIIFAPFISQHWIKSNTLTANNIKNVIMLMGGVIAFQWPLSIYGGGMMGLQKQVHYNLYLLIFNTLKSLGVILILKYFSPTLYAFFIYQIIITFLGVVILKKILWYFLPYSEKKLAFSSLELKKIGKFAIGMTGVGLSSLILGQLDKVLLSKLLSLKDYGYYTFGFSIGSSIALLSGVLGTVLLPRLSQVVAKDNLDDITKQYHNITKILASSVTPIAIFLFFFSKEILSIWLKDIETVSNIWKLVSLISLGSLFNTYVMGSYFLLIAYGSTKFTIYQNVIASIISLPLLYFSVHQFGLLGGSSICLGINFCFFIFSLPAIHRMKLKGELKNVYIYDIAPSLIISFIIMFLFKYYYKENFVLIIKLLYFSLAVLLTYIFIILTSKDYRIIFSKEISKKINYSK